MMDKCRACRQLAPSKASFASENFSTDEIEACSLTNHCLGMPTVADLSPTVSLQTFEYLTVVGNVPAENRVLSAATDFVDAGGAL